jgi:hypothetical protein
MTDFFDHTLGFADVMSVVFIASAIDNKVAKIALGFTWFVIAWIQ